MNKFFFFQKSWYKNRLLSTWSLSFSLYLIFHVYTSSPTHTQPVYSLVIPHSETMPNINRENWWVVIRRKINMVFLIVIFTEITLNEVLQKITIRFTTTYGQPIYFHVHIAWWNRTIHLLSVKLALNIAGQALNGLNNRCQAWSGLNTQSQFIKNQNLSSIFWIRS